MADDPNAPDRAAAKAARETDRAADKQARDAAKDAREVERDADKQAREATKEARRQSMETLREQENMKPVPSQDDADKIKLGEQVNADEQQPEGPAADAEVSRSVGYTTRDAKAE